MNNSAARKNGSQISDVLSVTRSIALFIGVALLLRASVVEAFKIPSVSMQDTLQIKDHILVNKLSYGLRLPLMQKTIFDFRQPKRGDVVVFTLPDDPATPGENESDTNIIKRVIGLPGDTVEVKEQKIFINGELYEKDKNYAKWVNGGTKDFGPGKVPEGRVFLMGDNRDQSRDARFWNDHYLEISRIKGRAFIIYWNSAFMLNRMFTIIR